MNREAPLPNTLPTGQPNREFLRDRRLLVLGLGVLVGELAFLLAWPHGEDFWQHYLAAQKLLGIVTPAQQQELWPYPYGYPYLSFVALLISPLAVLPPLLAISLWTALSLMGLGLANWMFAGLLLPAGGNRRALWALGLSIWPASFVSVWMGQSAALMVLSLAVCAWLVRRGRSGRAGLALSLALIKPHLLVGTLAGLALHRRGRILGGFACGLAGLLLLSWALGPLGPPLDVEAYLPDWFLGGGFSVSLVGRLYPFSPPLAVGLALVGLVGLAIWWWRHPRPVGVEDAALGFTLSLLFIPHLRVHDLVLLNPVYMLALQRGEPWSWVSALLLSLGALVSTRSMLLDPITLALVLLAISVWRVRGVTRGLG
ncbi:MAG: DUF2029 domain-containing protein [Chloroflexi bacterium]|nr:DUF2029 domain-containing protein [Chloroflexota bacterium]